MILVSVLAALATILGLTVVYAVIRFAVRDGLVDGQRRLDRERGGQR